MFDAAKHIVAFEDAPWEALHDEEGNTLIGIRGKTGAEEVGSDGEMVGADLIEMQPGSSFPLHTHPGDHVLYALSGRGTVTIDGELKHFQAGTTFYIEAQYPHNVGTYGRDTEPFVIVAFGHPKKEVSATDRMHIVE
jgi:quercetin dioxygenase-like cupin family protein